MSGWAFFWIIVVVLIVVGILMRFAGSPFAI